MLGYLVKKEGLERKERFKIKKTIVLDLKNEESVVNYTQMLQSNIARMSNHSGIIKASIGVIFTILMTILIGKDAIKEFWWISIVITMMAAILDSYYLALEKTYIDKYNNLIEELNKGIINEKSIYDMKPKNTNLRFEIIARMCESIFSFSIIGFYIILIIISILVKII